MKHWQIAPAAPENFVSLLQQDGLHPLVAQVLFTRGYQSIEDIRTFLGYYDQDDNPFRMKGMVEAIYRLRMAIRNKETIAVYGDFDCDGVTSTVVLTQVLRQLGANVRPYIPNRVDEGYGLNSPALKLLAEEGVNVVVTVDCGIRSVEEVQDANEYGLDMIISDHHSIGPELPPAYAVINPKREDDVYPSKMLCGVGIAYKIAQAIYMEAQRRGYRAEGWHPDDWLDLVAIGTVADIVPLKGENRELVQRGLKLLNTPSRPGLNALYNTARIRPGTVNSTTIGFLIGPRINAAGRLQDAKLAAGLLATDDPKHAAQLANQLEALNRERQDKTQAMQQWAESQIPGDPDSEPLLFAADNRFEQGVVGLVASRLTEQYYRPSVVVQLGDEESHGSCRSIPEFHITKALEACDDLLERYGGHDAAAGFTVRNDNIEEFRDRLFGLALDSLLPHETLQPTLQIDAELALHEADLNLIHQLERIEPTGEANPVPLFVSRNVYVHSRAFVGKEGQHLKLQLTNGTGEIVEAITFRYRDRFGEDIPDRIDVAFHMEINDYQGDSVQLNIQDIRASQMQENSL